MGQTSVQDVGLVGAELVLLNKLFDDQGRIGACGRSNGFRHGLGPLPALFRGRDSCGVDAFPNLSYRQLHPSKSPLPNRV